MPDKQFWAGAASGSSRKMLAKAQRWFGGARPNRIVINYHTQLSNPYDGWRGYDLFVDSGAYSLFAPPPEGQGVRDYQTSAESYIQDIGSISPERYAWRDYVCETDVRDYHNVDVADQQRRTIESHIELADLHDDYGITAMPIPVAQGWDPQDYETHSRQLSEQGLVDDWLGVGTLCGRNDPKQVEDIIRAVRTILPDVNIHAFGLDRVCYTNEYIMDEIRSTDSLAYCYRYKRPVGWERWEYVLMMYMKFKADWDRAIGGADYQAGIDSAQSELADHMEAEQ